MSRIGKGEEGTWGTQIDLDSPLVQSVDLCFTMGSATGSMLATSSKVAMVGSKEEEVAVNVMGEVRENAMRSTLPSRIFNSC